ncbi:MAG: DASS family sodium-coupled anion symporter [Acidobacteria bacterium]|nr:DASS family sodium-coupled anion symporter [Acidobacteriota bacterium]
MVPDKAADLKSREFHSVLTGTFLGLYRKFFEFPSVSSKCFELLLDENVFHLLQSGRREDLLILKGVNMGWQDLTEIRAQLTPAEVRFEEIRRSVGFFLGPLAFLIIVLMPPLPEVAPVGMRTLGIFVWVVLWWMTEPIPIPMSGLLGLALLALCGVFSVSQAFGSLGHWVILFLLGAFIIAHAMTVSGLNRRFAYRMITFDFIQGNPWRLLAMFLIAATMLSSLISDTVTTVIFMAIGIGLLKALNISPGSRYGEMLILSTAWAALYGGMITPSGTPPNLIGIGLIGKTLNYQMGYARWTLIGVPMAIVGILAMLTFIRLSLQGELHKITVDPEIVRRELQRMGPMTRGEKIAGVGMLTAILLWLLPDVVNVTLGSSHPTSVWIRVHLDVSVVALLVATSMFMVPINWKEKKFPLTWNQAVAGVEWGTLALIAGALGIGDALANPTVGLGKFFSSTLGEIAGPGTSPWIPLSMVVLFMVFITSFISNNAAISIVAPIVIAIGSAPGSTLNPVAGVVAVAMAASMSFILPCSTPSTAIVFGSGYVRILTMFRKGMVLALIGALISTFVAYSIADFVFPWPPR